MIFTQLLSYALAYGRNRVYVLDIYCVLGNVLRKYLRLFFPILAHFFNLTTYLNST